MDEEKVKIQIGANIASHRKKQGWTQVGLAERINYSDKAVSKWERGESIPDVITLMLLAKEFGITINELVAVAADFDTEPKLKKVDRRVILRLCNILVWFIALFAFIVLASFSLPYWWAPFIYAIPITAIVQLCLRCAWHDFRYNRLLISLIAWGSLASIFITFLILFNVQLWLLFLLGIPGQIAILLWFRMFVPVEETKNAISEDSHG